MSKKYRLLPAKMVKLELNGTRMAVKMRRIQALIDIPRHGVKAGDKGGYVKARYTLSHAGDAWIGGNAKVYYDDWKSNHINVSENALVSGEAQIVRQSSGYGFKISGNSVITGNTRIGIDLPIKESIISGRAYIDGNVRISNPYKITDNAAIIGEVTINLGLSMSGESRIEDKVYVGKNLSIGDAAKIMENAKIGDGVNVWGKSVISGNAEIPSYANISNDVIGDSEVTPYYKNSYITNPPSTELVSEGATRTPIVSSQVAVSPVLTKSLKQLAITKNEIASYETDIVKLIQYPIMADLTDSHTLEMKIALEDVEMVNPQDSPEEFIVLVSNLRKKFLIAESNARKIASSMISADDKEKLEKAKKMFSIASNEVASETEKKNAFTQGFKKLEGIIAVPDVAVDTFRIKIGLSEIEA